MLRLKSLFVVLSFFCLLNLTVTLGIITNMNTPGGYVSGEDSSSHLKVRVQDDSCYLSTVSDIAAINYTNRAINGVITIDVPITGNHTLFKYCKNRKEFVASITVNKIDTKYMNGLSTLSVVGETYEKRFFIARNICWKWKRFRFFSPHSIAFNRTIGYPGSKPIPHDYPSCRLIFRLNGEDAQYPPLNSITYHEKSYLTCRWFSCHLFWHMLFDYTLPLYWTQKITGGVNREKNRVFTIDENTSKKGYQLIEAFTKYNVSNLFAWPRDNYTCFDNAVVGFPKAEYDLGSSKYNVSTDPPYGYPYEAFDGFRDVLTDYYNKVNKTTPVLCKKNNKNPRVVVSFRTSPKRHIVNKAELVNSIKQACPHCVVDTTYSNSSIIEQINFICNASVLIAIHGGGLSHIAFMEKGASAIEILPYYYTCRDWYKQIAVGAGINYFSWLNTHRENTIPFKKYERVLDDCASGRKGCFDGPCQEALRDQLTTVNISEFIPIFKKALSASMN